MSLRERFSAFLSGLLGVRNYLFFQGGSVEGYRDWRVRNIPLESARREITNYERELLVSKSRFYDRNAPIQNRIADIFEEFIVGTSGILLLGNSFNKVYNRRSTEYFAEWAECCDVGGRYSFSGLQGAAARAWFVDGEVFLVLVDVNGKKRLRLAETHEVRGYKRGDGNIIDGIEYDRFLRPVGYYIRNLLDDDFLYYPASRVIHIFTPCRPNQLRGLPYCYPVLNQLDCYMRLLMYEMSNAEKMARRVGFLTRKGGELDPLSAYKSSALFAKDNVETSSSGNDERATLLKNETGGDVLILGEGEDFKELVSDRPGDGALRLLGFLQNEICEGQGVGKLLYHPESVQGTVARADIQLRKSFFEGHSNVFSDKLKEVFRWVISDLPAGNVRGWDRVEAKPPRSIVVDIGRDSKAEIEEVNENLKSLRDYFAERGKDWKLELEQIAFEKSEMERLGLARNDINQIVNNKEDFTENNNNVKLNPSEEDNEVKIVKKKNKEELKEK